MHKPVRTTTYIQYMFAITRFHYIDRGSFPYIILLLGQGMSFVVQRTYSYVEVR